jgi:glyoxylase-like metal-dependent hydrolase (beta-lactamase superfamily II)/rhodanese-related sulfurtransferase
VIFRQYVDDDLFCASYLLGDAGEAIVVDPGWEIGRYLETARAHRLRIRHVLETHVHADHVSGRQRLAEATGATPYLPAGSDGPSGQPTLRDGDALRVGQVEVRVLATPGHRPEHVAYLVADTARAETPCLVLTGDSLLVGDVARPDLAADGEADVDAASRTLFATVNRLASLADHVEVWPGHLGGSLCGGAGVSGRPSSTIGYERRTSVGLRAALEDEFAAELLVRLPERPPTVDRVVALNRDAQAQPSVEVPTRLAPGEVRELLAAGALLLDGRPAEEFDDASIPGSLSIPLDIAGVGNRAAWFAAGRRIVLNAADESGVRLLAERLHAVGLFDIVGLLDGGIERWREAGYDVGTTGRIEADELARLLRDDAVTLVDLRDDDEYELAHVPGSVHIPWREVLERSAAAVEPGKPVIVACASGRRTPTAASALAQAGGPPVLRLAEGGIPDLATHGIALVSGPAARAPVF